MDLTPTTPVTKRTRAKAPSLASAPANKTTATPKKPRVRKKTVSAAVDLPTVKAGVALTPDQLAEMIATAAYLRAAARNFAPGGEVEDWLAAERQVLAGL